MCLLPEQAAAERAQEEVEKLSKDRDELTQKVQNMKASHRAVVKTLSAAEQTARRDLQIMTEELEVGVSTFCQGFQIESFVHVDKQGMHRLIACT